MLLKYFLKYIFHCYTILCGMDMKYLNFSHGNYLHCLQKLPLDNCHLTLCMKFVLFMDLRLG